MAEETQLSWQSAYWAIVPVALNAMTLPSGRVLGLPASWNFALRASPVFCALAAIHDCFVLGKAVIYNWSFSEGLAKWRLARFDDPNNTGNESFESLRKNRLFTTLLFVLGTVPAAVKVFATRNIPFTHVCCAAYLATFLVDTVIMFATKAHASHTLPGVLKDATVEEKKKTGWQYPWYPTLAVAASVTGLCTLMACSAYGSIVHEWTKQRLAGRRLLILQTLAPLPIAGLVWFLARQRRSPCYKAGQYVFTIGLLFTPLVVARPRILDDVAHDLHGNVHVYSEAFLFNGIALQVAGWYIMVLQDADPDFVGWAGPLLQSLFAFFHMAGAAFCYCFYHNAVSTSRPLWTNNLG